MKTLIVNADDYGVSEEVNRGIIRAHREGIVTGFSILACGEYSGQAQSAVAQNRALSPGIHLCLTEFKPVLPRSEIRSLLGKNARFERTSRGFLFRFLAGAVRKEEIRNELEAQILRVSGSGIRPTHIDFHEHLHGIPAILSIVVDLAGKHGIGIVRLPCERINPRLFSFRIDICKLAFLSSFSFSRRNLARNGPGCVDQSMGMISSGMLNSKLLAAMIAGLPEGVTEIMCHPAESNPRHLRHWKYDWERELEALLDPGIRREIARQKVRLAGFEDCRQDHANAFPGVVPYTAVSQSGA